jgi:hypothetical protein
MKFYKKRIIELTKQLLNDETPDFLSHDTCIIFEMYVKMCVKNFKTIDTRDILQEEYTSLDLGNLNVDCKNEINIDSIDSTEKANEMMMRQIKITKPPSLLDNFIKTKKVVKREILPKKKKINLKDPNLKNKGIEKKENINICEKKNITNNYDKKS